MCMLRSLLAVPLVLTLGPGLSGCSTLHPGSVDRSLEGRYEQVVRATVEVLRDRGFPLKRVELAVGRIVTGRRPVRMGREGRPVEKVNARLERSGPGEVKVSLSLVFVDQGSDPQRSIPDDGDDNRTDDVFEAAISRSFDAAAVYDAYLDAIQKRTNRRQENDTP